MTDEAPHVCRICGKPTTLPPENKAFPFCSSRCQNVDLAKWFGEDYRISTQFSERDLLRKQAELDEVDED